MKADTLTVRLDPDLKAFFKSRAEAEGRSVTQVVIRALEQAAKRWVKAPGDA